PPLSRPAPRTSPAPPLPRRDALPISDPGRVPLGTWVKLPATESMELVALAGFDFAVIDLEHSAMNLETPFRHIGTALLTGASPIVRVPSLESGIPQRMLGPWAEATRLPHVDSIQPGTSTDGPGPGPRGALSPARYARGRQHEPSGRLGCHLARRVPALRQRGGRADPAARERGGGAQRPRDRRRRRGRRAARGGRRSVDERGARR